MIEKMEKKIIVIGSGPAGISAALYARRGGASVTVVTKGQGALAKAERIENYYGFPEPITGAELERRGIEGARRLGITLQSGDAVNFLVEGKPYELIEKGATCHEAL